MYFREYAIADYLENNGYNDAFEAFKKDANIVCSFNDSFFLKNSIDIFFLLNFNSKKIQIKDHQEYWKRNGYLLQDYLKKLMN